MNKRCWFGVTGVGLALTLASAGQVRGCPFCVAAAPTFTEKFGVMDVVVIAQLAERLPAPASGSDLSSQQSPDTATFTVLDVFKGAALIGQQRTVSAALRGSGQAGDKFLLTGLGPQELTWSLPIKLTDALHRYLQELARLPADEVERLAFFQRFLEDIDPLISQDAYDEFARTPYARVKLLKPRMNHDQLVAWINDPQVRVNQKRLYYTMLGVCGDQRDVPMLERRLRSTEGEAKIGLDALIACYLMLAGPAGMPLIEQRFLANREGDAPDDYAQVYAAILALRFHGTEADVVPRPRLLQAFGLIVDRPQLADLVIPDFARWQDWSVLDRLVALFRIADPKVSHARVPIINFARACPLPAARAALEEFQRIDPQAVKRSMTFFPKISQESK